MAKSTSAAKPIGHRTASKSEKAKQAALKATPTSDLEKAGDKAAEEVLESTLAAPDTLLEETVPNRRAIDAMSFSLAQLSTPLAAPQAEPLQAQLTTPAPAIEEFNKAMEELKAKFGITGAIPVVKHPKAKDAKNGITRPGVNTTCGLIWKTADDLSGANKVVASIAMLKMSPILERVNDHTLKTQYARWRAYHGHTGRLPTIQANPTPKHEPFLPAFGDLPKF